MGSLGNSWENYVLDHLLKNSSLSAPDALYIALSTADPAEDASGLTEPSGGDYARKTMATWDGAAARATQNTNEILFNEATANWGEITHFAIMSTLSDTGVDYMVAYGAFTTSKSINNGDQARIAAGELDVSFNTISTGGISTSWANKVLDHIFMVSALGQPSNLYVGLSTASPGDDMSGNQEPPTANAYDRISMATWDAAAAGASENTNAVTFSEASAGWGTVTHVTIWDHASTESTTNFIMWAELDTARQITAGDTPRFSAGEIDITLT